MAIDFPSSPTTGDLYTYLGITYQWDGTHWVRTDPAITSITTVDNTIARFNGTTGIIQSSGVTVDDSNNIITPTGGIFTTAGNINGYTSSGSTVTPATPSSYTLQLNSQNMCFGCDGTYGYIQTFNSKPLNLNSQGNPVLIGSGQLQFPASQNASAGANVLDDYEEGTWTPAYVLSTVGTSSWTMSGGSGGNYTKIGRNVIIEWNMSTTAYSVGSGTGNVRISGLPFTVNAGRAATTSVVATVSWGANASVPVTALAQVSQTYLRLFKRPTSPGLDVELIQSDPNVGSLQTSVLAG